MEIDNTNAEIALLRESGKITSLQMAGILNRRHNELLKSIRKAEVEWIRICGRKFTFAPYDVIVYGRAFWKSPMYQLTKTECLYIATKFNAKSREKLEIHWEQLEKEYPQIVEFTRKELSEIGGKLEEEFKRLCALLEKPNMIKVKRKPAGPITVNRKGEVAEYMRKLRSARERIKLATDKLAGYEFDGYSIGGVVRYYEDMLKNAIVQEEICMNALKELGEKVFEI